MVSKDLISSKLAIAALVILLAFLTNLKYGQWKEQKLIDREKQNLIAQEQQLTQKNQEFTDSLSYLNSSDFKERMQRQQLNMKRDGEIVYNFSEAKPPENISAPSQDNSSKTNPQKWWDYLFSKN